MTLRPFFTFAVYGTCRNGHYLPTHGILLTLVVTHSFPKTYPVLACPTFRVEQAIGLNKAQAAKLEHAIQQEAQKYKGQEMVFQVRNRYPHRVQGIHPCADSNICSRVDERECQASERGLRFSSCADESSRRRTREGQCLQRLPGALSDLICYCRPRSSEKRRKLRSSNSVLRNLLSS